MQSSNKLPISEAGQFALWTAILIVSITLVITNTKNIIDFIYKTNSPEITDIVGSGTNSQEFSWDIHEGSGLDNLTSIIPSDVIGYYTYILEHWERDVDYIQKIPNQQPNMNARISTDNNVKMHDYLYKNQIVFKIPSTNKKGYIMFITTNPVSKDKNIFFGLNGKTIGWIDKNNIPFETYEKNQYLYELNNLLLVGNGWYRFSKDLSWIKKLHLNAVVWEANNKVEKIIIFFK